MNKENEIIKTDVKITRRISEDPEYMKRIIKAHQAVTTLEITNSIMFAEYSVYLEQLKDVNYLEATYYRRVSNDEYEDKIYKLAGLELPKRKAKIFDISRFM